MFNKLLQDKALDEGKNPRTSSSSKLPLAKSPSSTLASSASTSDSKGKRQVEPMSPPAKKTKVSSGSFAPPTPKPSSRARTPRPSVAQIKREKLSCNEASSLLKEKGETSGAAEFVKGLLTLLDRSFLETFPSDQVINSLASYSSKTILLLEDLLEHGGPASKEAHRKVEELALKYYYHGYQTCAFQFEDTGYPPLIAPPDFLHIHARLVDVSEPAEEVPQELPENLLHVTLEDEAPADP
ncbi:UNVERIFIED_CONTAM: hypothetical protein Scaly_1909300 [Sesamum calycinum]|uniref:Uncharacterized protein n=1 Tax=Sesamum calycinum TaxID=2727403 RepID=A0AAW2NEK4_9LAMI